MTVEWGNSIVSGSWISDTPDEVEHPSVPLGINEMAIPRAAILLSLATAALLICSTIVVGYSVYQFAKANQDAFSVTDTDLLKDGNDRWFWELDLLFDTCDSRLGDWDWPEVLADQDDVFLYPGELRCDWEHQGEGDRASVVVYNRGDQPLDLVLEIAGGNVVFATEGDADIILEPIEANGTAIVEIELQDGVTEHDITIEASHVRVPDAEVLLDVHIFEGSEPRALHASDGDQLGVHYKVWNADTGDLLDEGDLVVTAGDDSRYIKGFGWSAIGLDIDEDRGLILGIDTGTSHITLLPPPIAYGNSDGHELEEAWLRFELKVDRATI
uniref:Putative FKBP-type peptidyl-prolyl cis-trans isomerase n=2 Tax=prokaryotic environmental samples TaxID=81490 RepID=B3T5B5_9ZZZZ|nr:putative FKBP-type peptidyl-prolyl cis-trans isomerase [uncultured marine microorganism HF4000_ANIW133F6]ABZ07774.1 putative FKBP-type peptidyl-prolyl cis-trans isomerase [uncultured marine microorganism HF4000_ANIW141C7]